METLPNEIAQLIMSYAHPIHPCKEDLMNRLVDRPAWHLWMHPVEWDSMSAGAKAFCFGDDAEDHTEYGY